MTSLLREPRVLFIVSSTLSRDGKFCARASRHYAILDTMFLPKCLYAIQGVCALPQGVISSYIYFAPGRLAACYSGRCASQIIFL